MEGAGGVPLTPPPPLPQCQSHTEFCWSYSPLTQLFFFRDEKNVDHCKNLSIPKRKRKKIKTAWNAPTLRKSTILMLALVPSFASLCFYTHVLVYKKLVKMVIIVDAFFPFKIITYLLFWFFFLRKPMLTVWCGAFQISHLLIESHIKPLDTRMGLFLLLFLYKNVTVLYITSLLFAYLT